MYCVTHSCRHSDLTQCTFAEGLNLNPKPLNPLSWRESAQRVAPCQASVRCTIHKREMNIRYRCSSGYHLVSPSSVDRSWYIQAQANSGLDHHLAWSQSAYAGPLVLAQAVALSMFEG